MSTGSQMLLDVPHYDNNEYDQLILPNGILATLVSDPSLQR
jgi:secreted Zn-dependent insulinase-like peptidase